ncbi:hypothetical protein GCM10011405_33870 [Rufibacter glacialis]|nr:hypothetical protein GCM10011405_33870 [Rufibacter glacialis]
MQGQFLVHGPEHLLFEAHRRTEMEIAVVTGLFAEWDMKIDSGQNIIGLWKALEVNERAVANICRLPRTFRNNEEQV